MHYQQGLAGVPALYFAVAFSIRFTLWFGAYGAIAAYARTVIGSGLLSGNPAIPPVVAIYWSIAALLQVLIPLIALRTHNANLTLENRRDWTLLLLFGVLINNFIGAAWGAFTLAFANVISSSQIGCFFTLWLIGNIIVTIIIVPIGLRYGSPSVRKTKFFVRNYWD